MNEPARGPFTELLRPHTRTIVLITIIQIIGLLAQIGTINILKPLLNEGVYGEDMGDVIRLGLLLLILTVVVSLIMVATSYLSSKVAMAVSRSLRSSIMSTVIRSKDLDQGQGSTTSMMTSLTTDVSSVERYIYETLNTYIPMPILLVALLCCTYMINSTISIIMAVCMLILVLFTYMLSRRVYPYYGKQVEETDSVNNLLREKVTGARLIRAYNGFDYEEAKFSEASTRLGKMATTVEMNRYYIPFLSTAFTWMFMVFVFMATALDKSGQIVPADIVLFMQYVTYIISTLAIIPYLCVGAPRARVCYMRIREVVSSSRRDEKTRGRPDDMVSESALKAEDLSYRDSLGRMVLDKVNIDIKTGETVTILGPNGSGSSTLLNIALGFREPLSGSLTVNGMDVSDTHPRFIRNAIAMAGNDMHIFRGTLRYNLDPHDRHTDEEIMSVVDKLGLEKMISKMDAGLDSEIIDGTSSMSGGQRLLLIIARALLKDVEIYIFDDCFFSLDGRTRDTVQRAISDICKGKTVIYVMHDVSTCESSERVFLLKSGILLDHGTHDDLLGRSDLYNDMCRVSKGRPGTWV